MTNKEQIERITKLLNELSLDDITSAEFDEMFPKQSIDDIKDEMWRLYCFAEDVCDTINMGDTAEQEPKTGHWIYKQYDGYPECGDYHCSGCDKIDNRIPTYCPNCGRHMVEPQERSE